MRDETSTTGGKVHLISLAAAVTSTMRTFVRGQYYAMPCLPEDFHFPIRALLELGILAGNLYMDYDMCEALRKYLGTGGGLSAVTTNGTVHPSLTPASGTAVATNGYSCSYPNFGSVNGHYSANGKDVVQNISKSVRDITKDPGEKCTFCDRPAVFLLEWLAARRSVPGLEHTPVGQVCLGRPLKRDHVFFNS